jgi:hypothetical protein
MTEPQRIALDEEGRDLSIHVRMCAMRHQQIMDTVSASNARLARIEKAAWGIITILGGAVGVGAAELLPIMRAMAGQ